MWLISEALARPSDFCHTAEVKAVLCDELAACFKHRAL